MKIASWNVNSIKARKEHALNWIKDNDPDILMLQELKGLDTYPHKEVDALGYDSFVKPQKTYNGVATLVKKSHNAKLITDILPGNADDEQSRFIDIEVNGIRFINIYLPNGNPYPGEKYDYKMNWMDRLYTYLKELADNNIPFAIGGDFNVIPEAKDAYDATAWTEDALYVLTTRQQFRRLINLGLTDAFRVFNHADQQYTFWDYQRGAWPQNKGIRIDHFLLSPTLADKLQSCVVDKTPRGLERPSDHTPIVVIL